VGIVFKNNAKTTLASNLSNSATSASVTDGSVFPSLGAGEFFIVTFDDGTNNEVCKCTARSSNTLTIVRAQEGSSARAFNSGDGAEGRVTAGVLESIQENIAAKSANQTVYNATAASSATAYDIGVNPGVEANAMVFLDGVMQHHDTFSFSGSTLTFDAAPTDGTKIEVIVDNLINLQSSNLTVDTFTATSGQTAFTLSDAPGGESNVLAFVEGVFQNQSSFSLSSNTLTLDTGIVVGRAVTVYIINPVNIGTPSDSTVTSAKLSGNITLPGSLTVGSHDVAFDSPTFVVDNSNSRVGLGTANPTVPVDIVGETKMSSHLTLGTTSKVQFGDSGTYIHQSADGVLDLVSDNEIEINATTIDVNGALDVSGNITGTLATAAQTNITSVGTLTGFTSTGIDDNADATAITIGADESVDFAKGVVVLGSGTTAGVYLNGTNSDTATHGNFVRYGTNFATQSNADNSLLITKAFNGSIFLDAFTVKSDGKVGIGTTTANKIFNIADPAQGGETLKLHFEAESSADKWAIYSYDRTNGHYADLSFGGNYLYLKSGGNVGIGTSSPSALLHLEGADGVAQIRLQRASTTIGGIIKQTSYGLSYDAFDGNTGAPSHQFRTSTDGTNFTEKMRLDASGKLGIGTTSPHSAIHTHIASSGGTYHQFTNSSTGDSSNEGWKIGIHDDENFIIWGQESSESFRVYNNGAYRFTIDHNGAVGIPAAAKFYLDGISDTYMSEYSANEFEIVTGNTRKFALSGGNLYHTGSINSNHSFSDERLKDNIVVIPNALEKVSSLRGITFTRKDDGSVGTGLIAQELEKVLPEAVYESKTIDTLENPDAEEWKAINYGNTVGLLVEAIKELEARIKTLEDA